jgi:FMN phosphatase YigB (HAD superfamily)
MTRNIRMVCFDLGGVLIRHHRTWADGCRAVGLPVLPVLDDPASSTARKELSALHTTGRIDGAEFCRRIAETMQGAYSPADVASVHHAWLIGEYPGARAVVERLADEPRIETGILSNTNAQHWARFCAEGERRPEFPTILRVRHRHASHLLGLAKPDPRIYDEYARRTGMGECPGAILFFDDLPENVEVARARGWTAELIDHTRDTASQLVEHLRGHGVL